MLTRADQSVSNLNLIKEKGAFALCGVHWFCYRSDLGFIPKLEVMTNIPGEESRSDIEARLDRILRDESPTATPPQAPRSESPNVSQPVSIAAEAIPAKPKTTFSLSKNLTRLSKGLVQWFGKLFKQASSAIKNARKTWPERPKSLKPKPFAGVKKALEAKGSKRLAVLASSLTTVVGLVLAAFLNFTNLTVASGIETTLGPSDNRSVFVVKASDAGQGDLIVASLSIDSETGQELLIIGTVFSKNEQSYALYDGEVIWQISAEQIRGKVLFAEATQTP